MGKDSSLKKSLTMLEVPHWVHWKTSVFLCTLFFGIFTQKNSLSNLTVPWGVGEVGGGGLGSV